MLSTPPTLEEIDGLIRLHPHLGGLLGSSTEVAGFVAEGILRICPGCSCWNYRDDFREAVSYCPIEGTEYEVADTCRWCRED